MSFQDASVNEESKGPNVALMNWQGEEFCGVNQVQVQNQPHTPTVVNTRLKKCAIDIRQQAANYQQQVANHQQQAGNGQQQGDKGKQQPSTSHQATRVPLPIQNMQILPRGQPAVVINPMRIQLILRGEVNQY